MSQDHLPAEVQAAPCWCDVNEIPLVRPCDDYCDGGLGTCVGCGHERACHDENQVKE
jgi:hypothetical protein